MEKLINNHPNDLPEIQEKIKDFGFRSTLLSSAKERGIYNNEGLKKLKEFASGHETIPCDKYVKRAVIEHLVFSSVGIFCAADLSVFDDDSAQLMFAHYGENLKGLALIYEISSLAERDVPFHPIKYRLICDECLLEGKGCLRNEKPSSPGTLSETIQWIHGDFTKSQDFRVFLNKSSSWCYEKEKRLFAKPGPRQAEEYAVSLKAILYTPRFDDNQRNTLDNINSEIYNDKLLIQLIRPSTHYYNFITSNGEVNTWIEDKIIRSEKA
ncbi:MAG: hypothetical protein ACTHJ4_06945 [Candidatus Nucleicultricaceae bacterium]